MQLGANSLLAFSPSRLLAGAARRCRSPRSSRGHEAHFHSAFIESLRQVQTDSSTSLGSVHRTGADSSASLDPVHRTGADSPASLNSVGGIRSNRTVRLKFLHGIPTNRTVCLNSVGGKRSNRTVSADSAHRIGTYSRVNTQLAKNQAISMNRTRRPDDNRSSNTEPRPRPNASFYILNS